MAPMVPCSSSRVSRPLPIGASAPYHHAPAVSEIEAHTKGVAVEEGVWFNLASVDSISGVRTEAPRRSAPGGGDAMA
eukprot:7385377-Prymnesium_polylepis.3